MDVEAQQHLQQHGDEEEEEARQHKRLSHAWRESLHALAQNLKCPICLGYVHTSTHRSVGMQGKEGGGYVSSLTHTQRYTLFYPTLAG